MNIPSTRFLTILLLATAFVALMTLTGAQDGCVPDEPPQPLTCNPATELACGDELVCVAETIEEDGSCLEFDHGQTVGAGYSCGGSIGVGCAEGLYCAGLPKYPGWIGGTGTCTLMECSDWYKEYQDAIKMMNTCTTADECVAIPGTSCGCTHDVVLNKNADTTMVSKIINAMNADECGIMTTCDCPQADGFKCESGHCAWNYL